MRTRRLLGATALTTLVAVSLAGCVKMDMQLDLQTDDTVDGSMVFAVSNALAEMTGQDPATIAEEMSGDTFDMDEGTITSTEPYDDGEYVGSEITFEGESLDSFAGATGEELSIVRDGDEFVVSGTMDLSDAALGTEGAGGDEMMSGLMEGFDIQISITFPGSVSEHNGELDGNTVTWTPQYGEATEISARGSAIEGGGGSGLPLPLLIGIGAAVLVAAALIIFLVMRSRKNAAAAQPAAAGYAPTSYVPPAQGYTPPAAEGYAPAPTAAPAPPAAAPPVAPPAPPVAPPAPPQEQAPPPPPA